MLRIRLLAAGLLVVSSTLCWFLFFGSPDNRAWLRPAMIALAGACFWLNAAYQKARNST